MKTEKKHWSGYKIKNIPFTRVFSPSQMELKLKENEQNFESLVLVTAYEVDTYGSVSERVAFIIIM